MKIKYILSANNFVFKANCSLFFDMNFYKHFIKSVNICLKHDEDFAKQILK